MRRLVMSAVFAGLVVLARTSEAGAQPVVQVRAESRIELRAGWGHGALRVDGVLRDDLATPLPGATIELRVQPVSGGATRRRTVRTDEGGALGADFEVAPGPLRLAASYGGDAHHERVEVERVVDASRAEVRLRVAVPDEGRLRLDAPDHAIEVRVDSDAPTRGLRVRLTDELGRGLATSDADAQGVARFRVPSSRLGAPSAGRLVARTDSDPLRAEAQTEVPIVRVAPTRVSLAVSHSRPVRGDAIRARGRLVDFAGRPLPREAIGLFAGRARVTTTLTDADGSFDARLAPPREGPSTLLARFESDAPWREPSASPGVAIVVLAPNRTPVGWVIATLVATATILAAVGVGGRRRVPPAPLGSQHPPAPGVEAGARRFRADRDGIGGVVVSLRGGDPVAEAHVRLRGSADAADLLTVSCDPLGRFALAGVAPGDYALEIVAPGHEAVVQAIRVPHRGEWSATRVRLERSRDRALDALTPVAAALFPGRHWGTTTPGEVRARAEDRRLPREPVATLAEGAERAGFAAKPPSAEELRATEAARDAVLDALHFDTSRSDTRR